MISGDAVGMVTEVKLIKVAAMKNAIKNKTLTALASVVEVVMNGNNRSVVVKNVVKRRENGVQEGTNGNQEGRDEI